MLRINPVNLAFYLLPLALVACGDKSGTDDPRTQPPLVRAVNVADAGNNLRSFTGVVVARTQSDLGFRVQGKILERLVDTGQTVKRGQPLMRLDPADFVLQAQSQQQAVSAARARARQTSLDEARYRGLVATGAVSASAYDQIKAAADSAKADLNAAQAQADVAQNAKSYAVLLADADGVVMETLAEPGQVVSAGQPVIRLARAGQREALIQLPETLRPVPGSQAEATLYGDNERSVSARLRVLSDAAEPLTRTFEARYVLEGALADAPLGATVTLHIADGKASREVMQVPITALFDPGKGPGVWVITGEPARVSWRAVQVESMSDDAAKVIHGLSAGEEVVALGAHLLHNGETVRVARQGDGSIAGGQPHE